MATFTIITSTFNSAETLPACIASVCEQTHAQVDHLIVDGNSTDGTKAIIERAAAERTSRISWWTSEQDSGIYDAWNKALPHVTGDWVLFLGADDTLHATDVLAEISAHCDERADHEHIVYGKVRRHGFNDGYEELWGIPWEQAVFEVFEWAVFGSTIPHQAVFQRSSSFTELGPFDSSYRVAGDSDMLLRALGTGTLPHFVDTIVTDMRAGGISGAADGIVRNWREDLRLFRQHGIPRSPLRRLVKYAKWLAKIALFSLPGARKLVFSLADAGRWCQGKEAYWKRLNNEGKK